MMTYGTVMLFFLFFSSFTLLFLELDSPTEIPIYF